MAKQSKPKKTRGGEEMPNIELQGFSGDQGMQTRDLLISVLQSLALDDDTVITVVQSVVVKADSKRRSMPFIRVCGTEMDEIHQIIAGLKKAGLRVNTEWLLLGGFIHAKNMDDADDPLG